MFFFCRYDTLSLFYRPSEVCTKCRFLIPCSAHFLLWALS
jgi:hypothetical protein